MTLSLYSLDSGTAREFELSPEYVPSAEGDEMLSCHSLEKDWHVVHFLLAGTAEGTDQPLGLLYEAGIYLTPPCEEVWVVSADQVRAFRDALRELSNDDLRRRFDPEAMAAADVYRGHGLTRDDFDPSGLGIPELRSFAEACADRGCGAIITIC